MPLPVRKYRPALSAGLVPDISPDRIRKVLKRVGREIVERHRLSAAASGGEVIGIGIEPVDRVDLAAWNPQRLHCIAATIA